MPKPAGCLHRVTSFRFFAPHFCIVSTRCYSLRNLLKVLGRSGVADNEQQDHRSYVAKRLEIRVTEWLFTTAFSGSNRRVRVPPSTCPPVRSLFRLGGNTARSVTAQPISIDTCTIVETGRRFSPPNLRPKSSVEYIWYFDYEVICPVQSRPVNKADSRISHSNHDNSAIVSGLVKPNVPC